MQQEQLNWITQWYQQSTDYIILFSHDWQLLWQNRSCPMLRSITDYRTFFGLSDQLIPHSGSYTLCHAGELYGFQLDLHGPPDGQLYLIRIGKKPYLYSSWENPAWCHETENQIATMRHQIFGISNAVASLYNTIEEFSDDCPRPLLEEQMQQLNVIKGNCCRLMRPSIFWAEQSKYHQKMEISGQPLFLDREMSNFVESCRKILGRSIQMQLKSDSYLCIFANHDRLSHCLLCLILHIKRTHPDTTQLFFEAVAQGEQVVLSCTTDSNGLDMAPHRHSGLEPLYQTPLISQEETVIRLFCRTYDVTLLETQREGQAIYAFRFPECEMQAPLSFHSTEKILEDDVLSLYQILLADISSYRFY